mmetsp:Transcript_65736/g.155275  ORF Transcript_65736/g.155275 Transcript_65736/m.155275 type:complete len:158 (+) Transcript_65736:169-642(+)|eukprot:CAMPEP_0117000772 /NCGR_PEP_ID=MMETSP0472-20121206/2999_1 /TAXON_ID=693140 ORGANISM="Tiarina fusus, Strain LIS" /NCGR_SAMPLE_ID=MMETSP0472 /ASSEMBLY_ACC=CAM_ASM_000603 /LENGTH=157 /DNA_ID=CAMNT_0004700569 /DNA_START=159 /DNA_END=632 /DNA_ORIENTATION=+
MAGDWSKLGSYYAGNDQVQIVDVDCTADGGGTCQKMGVQGYPTLKYFTDSTGKSGKPYQGGRDYNALKAFVESTLNKGCNPQTGAGCAPNEKAYIDKVKAMSPEELKAEKTNKTETLKAVKKEKSEAEAEWKKTEKTLKKKETNINKALNLLKKLGK